MAEKNEPTIKEDLPIEAASETAAPKPEEQLVIKKPSRLRSFFSSKGGKITTAILAILVIIGILLGIPSTRYAILGTFIKKDATITLIDSSTKTPVSDATVILGDKQFKTDSDGKATLNDVSVGPHSITIQKNYYSDTTVTLDVWILKSAEPSQIEMQATGRQVPISVINTVSLLPIDGATITAANTSALTDSSGDATLVLPTDQTEISGTVSLDGYNSAAVTITVTSEAVEGNTFSLTPAGYVYFLSKRTGVINVMKANLDGTQQEVVIEGTGSEEEGGTQLVATRDWSYSVIKARRDSKNAKLYLLPYGSSSLSVIDTEEASEDTTFDIVGWYNQYLIYIVNGQILKSYNADTNTITALDQVVREGSGNNYASEYFGAVHILEDKIVYAKNWSYSCKTYVSNACAAYSDYISGKNATITSVNPDGSSKQTLKQVAIVPAEYPRISSKAIKTDQVIFRTSSGTAPSTYDRYQYGSLSTASDITDAIFVLPKTTYFVSPSGDYSFWYESRDGKNVLFLGDAAGNNAVEVASGTDFTPLGWYSDDYLLVSKDGSELYILPRQDTSSNSVKITDFHKPAYSWPGAGYSYGWYYYGGYLDY